MVQLIFVWARPLLALGRFYLHRAEVKRRFLRLQQRRPQPAFARNAATETFRDLPPLEYRDAA